MEGILGDVRSGLTAIRRVLPQIPAHWVVMMVRMSGPHRFIDLNIWFPVDGIV